MEEIKELELQEKVIVPIKTLKWVALALSKDSHRSCLQKARIDIHKEKTWIVATDTARLHVAAIEGELPPCPVDIKRILWDARFYRDAESIGFVRDGMSIKETHILDDKGDTLETINRDLYQSTQTYPNWVRVVPEDPALNPEKFCVAFNFHYLADAAKMANSARVHVMGNGTDRPHVIASHAEKPFDCDWFACIMPMMAGVKK